VNSMNCINGLYCGPGGGSLLYGRLVCKVYLV
jgi:hypothetical protein